MSFSRRRSNVYDLVNSTDKTPESRDPLLTRAFNSSEKGQDDQERRVKPFLQPIDTPNRCVSILGCADNHPKAMHERRGDGAPKMQLPGFHTLTSGNNEFPQSYNARQYYFPDSGKASLENASGVHMFNEKGIAYESGCERRSSDKPSSGAVTNVSDPFSCNSGRRSRDSFSMFFHTCQAGPNALSLPSTAGSTIGTNSGSSSRNSHSRMSSGQFPDPFPGSYQSNVANERRVTPPDSDVQLPNIHDSLLAATCSTSEDDFAVKALTSMKTGDSMRRDQMAFPGASHGRSASSGEEMFSPTDVRGLHRPPLSQVFEGTEGTPVLPDPISSSDSAHDIQRPSNRGTRNYPSLSAYQGFAGPYAMYTTEATPIACTSNSVSRCEDRPALLSRHDEASNSNSKNSTTEGFNDGPVSLESSRYLNGVRESVHGYGPIRNLPSPGLARLTHESDAEAVKSSESQHNVEIVDSSPEFDGLSQDTTSNARSLQRESQRLDRSFECEYMVGCNTANNNPRKGFSDYFGRNKICTKAVPAGAWILKCRQHYQRVKYRCQKQGQYGSYKAGNILRQIDRFEKFMGHRAFPEHGNIKWSIGFQKELATAVQKAQARVFQKQPLLLDSEDKKVQELMKQVNVATRLVHMTGEKKTSEDCVSFVTKMEALCKDEGLNDLIPAEFLPVEWGGKEYSRSATTARH